MTDRIILVAFHGGPLDGDTEELKVHGAPPFSIWRARPVPISLNFAESEEPPLSQGNTAEYQLRGGPGLIGRTGDGGWIYDYKGTT